MPKLRAWLVRLAGLVRRSSRDRDLASEIETNIDLHVEDNIRAGMTPIEARRKAVLRFGSIDAAKEAVRDRHGIPFLETLARDVSYAARTLRLNKGWTAVAFLSLTLGIGVNTALFGVVNGIFLATLPVPQPDGLISLRWVGENTVRDGARNYGYTAAASQGGERQDASFSFRVFQELRKQSEPFAELFAFAPLVVPVNVYANGATELASGQSVSGEFYRSLGVPAERGRPLTSDDDSPAAPPAAMISYRYWQRRFGLDPATVGSSITINSVPFTIVGVTPMHLGSLLRAGEDAPDITIPLAMEPRVLPTRSLLSRPGNIWLLVMGRIKPETTAERLQARLETVFERTAVEEWNEALSAMPAARRAQMAAQTGERGTHVPRLRVLAGSQGVYDARPEASRTLIITGVIVALVLLIVCVNLANLQLSRAEARRKEFVMRVAIGATPSRLLRQLLTESTVLALTGGAGGLLAAYWLRTLLPVWFGFPAAAIDWNVIAFAIVTTALTGMIFGLVPAIRASRAGSAAARQAPAGKSRLAQSLLAVQMAMSIVLLLGAGLFLQTLRNLQAQDIGFNPDQIAIFSLAPPADRYSPAAASVLYEEVLGRLEAIPGIQSATLSDPAVLSGAARRNFVAIDGQGQPVEKHVLTVHHTYFDTMRIPVRMGRAFTSEDNVASPRVTIVNEAFAKEFFTGTNPLGRRLRWQNVVMEIVGIVGNAKYANLRDDAPPTFYVPHLQRPAGSRWFAVRSAGDAAAVVPAIRDVMRSIDPSLPVLSLSTQTESIGRYLKQERVFAATLSFFGAMALVISTIGIFGLTSYSVARRTKEIGIRMAVGGRHGQIVRSMLRETMALVLIGAAIGVGAALLLTPFVSSMLFGLSSSDPATIAAVVTLMTAAATLAGYLPARRAALVDPTIALRDE